MDMHVEFDTDEAVIVFGSDHGIRLETWVARPLRNQLRPLFGEEEDENNDDEDESRKELDSDKVLVDVLEEHGGDLVQIILPHGWYNLRFDEAEELLKGLERIPLDLPPRSIEDHLDDD